MVILRLRRPKPAEPSKIPPPLDTLLDLLNRDQRTILTINQKSRDPRDVETDVRFDRSNRSTHSNHSIDISNSNPDEGFNKNIKSRSHRGPRRRFAPNQIGSLFCRLGEVFIVGVCLLTIVRVPTVMSAPSTRHAKEPQIHIASYEPTEDSKNYVHPCMTPEEAMNNSYLKKASNETNPDILKNIIIVAKNALAYAEGFRDRYVEETFHTRFEHHHRQFRNQMYVWLPNESNDVPKSLGKKLNPIHMKSKTLDELLIKIYKHMQTFAVALEQVVKDQETMRGAFRQNFKNMGLHLQNVICELGEGMVERNITPKDTVPRSVMKDEVRHLHQASFINVRDWLIFRDLMNCLEYTIDVFIFIENQPQEIGITSS